MVGGTFLVATHKSFESFNGKIYLRIFSKEERIAGEWVPFLSEHNPIKFYSYLLYEIVSAHILEVPYWYIIYQLHKSEKFKKKTNNLNMANFKDVNIYAKYPEHVPRRSWGNSATILNDQSQIVFTTSAHPRKGFVLMLHHKYQSRMPIHFGGKQFFMVLS